MLNTFELFGIALGATTNYTQVAASYTRAAAIAQCNAWATNYTIIQTERSEACWPLLNCNLKVKIVNSNPR
jgi:hypothetical protein